MEQPTHIATEQYPSFQTRAIAFLIDSVIAYAISLLPVVGGLIGGAYMLLRDGLTLDFANGRSIGKHLMKIRPIRLDGQPMDLATSARRNWMFALGLVISALVFIPIVGWLLIPLVAIFSLVIVIIEAMNANKRPAGIRIGDKMAGTEVVFAEE